MERLEVRDTVSKSVDVGHAGDETLRIPATYPCGEGMSEGDVPELLLRFDRSGWQQISPRSERNLRHDIVVDDGSPFLASDGSRPGRSFGEFIGLERPQQVGVGVERPIRCALHVLVPGAQLVIERVSQNKLEHMDCLERRACGAHIPYEEFMGPSRISAAFVEQPAETCVTDEARGDLFALHTR